jgi:hypothetical protein
MTEGAVSDSPPEPDRADGLVEEAQDARRKLGRVHDPVFPVEIEPAHRVEIEPAHREILEQNVERFRRMEYSRGEIVSRLMREFWIQPEEMPPEGHRIHWKEFAALHVRAVWPIMVREGIVDQSEMHILVSNGGCLDEEPAGVDVALIGRDRDDDVIVEFLPMEGVDPEEAEGHRRYTAMLIASRAERGPHPSRGLDRDCGSTSNAYGPLRFNLRLGIRPLQHWPRADRRTAGLVTKQPLCVEGIGALGRFKVYNKVDYVGIELARDEVTIKGWIVWLDEDSVAVVLRRPFRGGCVCRTISKPDENGHLVNEEGHLNGYGLQVVVELLNQMYEAAVAMDDRARDIKSAILTARLSMLSGRAPIATSVDAQLRAIWKAVPEPPFDFDIAFFKSGLHAWGKENPDYFEDGVWWVD